MSNFVYLADHAISLISELVETDEEAVIGKKVKHDPENFYTRVDAILVFYHENKEAKVELEFSTVPAENKYTIRVGDKVIHSGHTSSSWSVDEIAKIVEFELEINK